MSVASMSTPIVAHTPVDRAGLLPKISIKQAIGWGIYKLVEGADFSKWVGKLFLFHAESGVLIAE